MRHSIYSVIFEQADELEADERYQDALHLLYQGVRWADADAVWWERLSILSFVMAGTDWPSRKNLAHTHLADMGYVNTLPYLSQALLLVPDCARLHFFRGWFHFKLKDDRDVARQALAKALCLEPEHPYAWAALARLEMTGQENGYEQRALDHLARASASLPESARFFYEQGALLMGLGEYERAEEYFLCACTRQGLTVPKTAVGRYLSAEFHGNAHQVRDWITQYYPTCRIER